MQDFKIKNALFVFSVSLLSCAIVYALNIYPWKLLSSLYQADFAFFTATRFGLNLLVLIYPFKKLGTKILAYFISFFAIGFIVPIVHITDAGDLVYIQYFVLFTLIITGIHFLLNSRFSFPVGVSYMPSIIFIISSICLMFLSVPWTKVVIGHYAKHYVVSYVNCHPDWVSVEQYRNICSNLTGDFWENGHDDHGGKSYQDRCYEDVEKKKDGNLKSRWCSEVARDSFNPSYKFTRFLSNYWNLNAQIGLPVTN